VREEHHGLDVEDNGLGCKENGVGRADHSLQGFVHSIFVSLSQQIPGHSSFL
jgi:hypothetical protein